MSIFIFSIINLKCNLIQIYKLFNIYVYLHISFFKYFELKYFSF